MSFGPDEELMLGGRQARPEGRGFSPRRITARVAPNCRRLGLLSLAKCNTERSPLFGPGAQGVCESALRPKAPSLPRRPDDPVNGFLGKTEDPRCLSQKPDAFEGRAELRLVAPDAFRPLSAPFLRNQAYVEPLRPRRSGMGSSLVGSVWKQTYPCA